MNSLTEFALDKRWFKRIGLTRTKVDDQIIVEGFKYGKHPFTSKEDKKIVENEYQVVHFDLETFPKTEINIAKRFPEVAGGHLNGDHIAYCAAWKIGNNATQKAWGLNCVRDMLDSLPADQNFLMWAHNAGFDERVLIWYLSTFDNRGGFIVTGNMVKQLVGTYKGRRLVFKDTRSFISCSLAEMPEQFPGACGEVTLEKESFPHDVMNADTFDSMLPLERIKSQFEDYEALVKNASKIDAIKDNALDVQKYAIHYCKRDVDVLALCFQHISMPGLAYAILNNDGAYNGCFSMAGPCLSFARKALVAGRVMTRGNNMWHVKVFDTYSMINDVRVEHHKTEYTNKEVELIRGTITSGGIFDFDAVSLYPSAMAFIPGFVKGRPQIHGKEIPENDFHISKVKILSIGRKLHFPLQSIKEDNESHKYALEDLVEFQQASYEVIERLYWKSGFNPQICVSITKLLEERLKLKIAGNPLQGGIKMLMNSSYGKLSQNRL
ncbi:putative DNA-directed DNA polymerase, family B, mitochondria/virus, ribonuclease H-like superfamily [Plasmopara halstedii]